MIYTITIEKGRIFVAVDNNSVELNKVYLKTFSYLKYFFYKLLSSSDTIIHFRVEDHHQWNMSKEVLEKKLEGYLKTIKKPSISMSKHAYTKFVNEIYLFYQNNAGINKCHYEHIEKIHEALEKIKNI